MSWEGNVLNPANTLTGADLSESDSELAAGLGYTKNAAAFETSHLRRPIGYNNDFLPYFRGALYHVDRRSLNLRPTPNYIQCRYVRLRG